MFKLMIDGAPYGAYATEALAEAARATLKRWASLSTRFEIVPVAPAPAPCGGCGGAAARLVWRRGWVWGEGACRVCAGSGAAPATVPAAA